MFLFKRLKYALANFWNSLKIGNKLTEYLTSEQMELIQRAEMNTRCPCCFQIGWSIHAAIYYLRTLSLHHGRSIYVMRCRNCCFVLTKEYLHEHEVMSQQPIQSFIKSVKRQKFKPYLVENSKTTSE